MSEKNAVGMNKFFNLNNDDRDEDLKAEDLDTATC